MESNVCPKCRREIVFDEGPLCERCLGDVEMGRTLLGEYGKEEKRNALRAVASFYDGNPRREYNRLIAIAKVEGKDNDQT